MFSKGIVSIVGIYQNYSESAWHCGASVSEKLSATCICTTEMLFSSFGNNTTELCVEHIRISICTYRHRMRTPTGRSALRYSLVSSTRLYSGVSLARLSRSFFVFLLHDSWFGACANRGRTRSGRTDRLTKSHWHHQCRGSLTLAPMKALRRGFPYLVVDSTSCISLH